MNLRPRTIWMLSLAAGVVVGATFSAHYLWDGLVGMDSSAFPAGRHLVAPLCTGVKLTSSAIYLAASPSKASIFRRSRAIRLIQGCASKDPYTASSKTTAIMACRRFVLGLVGRNMPPDFP